MPDIGQVNVTKTGSNTAGQIVCRGLFIQVCLTDGCDNGSVVGTGNLHCKRLAVGAAIMVVHRQRIGQGDNLAGSQIVERGVAGCEGHRDTAGGSP